MFRCSRKAWVDSAEAPPDDAAPVDVRVKDEDTARSEENILQWMSYLPEDCIKTMIAMRWDVTT